MFKRALVGIVVIYLLQQLCIIVGPVLKSVFVGMKHARPYIAGKQGCLNGNGA